MSHYKHGRYRDFLRFLLQLLMSAATLSYRHFRNMSALSLDNLDIDHCLIAQRISRYHFS